MLDDGAEGDVQLGGRGGRPTSGDPIRLLDQGGRESSIDGHLGRGLEVGGSDPPARSVAQDERPASLADRLEMSASGAVGGGDLDHVHRRRLDGWRGAPVGENDVVMTDSGGSQPAQAAVTDPGGAEQEVRRLREAERESRRQAEVLKRHAQCLAAAASPHEIAETTMLKVKALGVTVAELTSPADTGLLVMASIGLTPEALARIASATLADDLPAATAMRTLSVGLPEPVGPSEFIGQILVALVEQTGLAWPPT